MRGETDGHGSTILLLGDYKGLFLYDAKNSAFYTLLLYFPLVLPLFLCFDGVVFDLLVLHIPLFFF